MTRAAGGKQKQQGRAIRNVTVRKEGRIQTQRERPADLRQDLKRRHFTMFCQPLPEGALCLTGCSANLLGHKVSTVIQVLHLSQPITSSKTTESSHKSCLHKQNSGIVDQPTFSEVTKQKLQQNKAYLQDQTQHHILFLTSPYKQHSVSLGQEIKENV